MEAEKNNKTSSFNEAFQGLEKKIKSAPNRGSFYLLKREVVDTGKCIACGTCAAICNYNALTWNEVLNKPELGDTETSGHCVACGVCYQQCPQVVADEGLNLGIRQQDFILKSNLYKGQDGGTVSTILAKLFDEEIIEAAIVTKQDSEKPWIPKAEIIQQKEKIGQFSGSIYSHSNVTKAVIEALQKGLRKLAVVGTPCKIDAVKKMISGQYAILKDWSEVEIITIGLFCMEAFNPQKLQTILEGKDIEIPKITKMDFSEGKFRIYYGDEEKAALAISSLHEAMESSCEVCPDFTAVNSDISVGSIGAPKGFNYVIVRSPKMSELINKMISEKIFTKEDLTAKATRSVIRSSAKKRERIYRNPDNGRKEYDPEHFIIHNPKEWNADNFNYTPTIHTEVYQKQEYKSISLENQKKEETDNITPVFIAKTPTRDNPLDITKDQYSTNYDLVKKLFEKKEKIKGAKILIKPNNTGFVGIFKNEVLSKILERNGITDDADHQPIATQPAMLTGMVDALLDLGVSEIHIGENMLWDGGTPRAFYETGYSTIFNNKKYRNRVFFIDFYENDPPSSSLEKVNLPNTKYCKGDYYNACYPPKALFSEKYDYILIASVVKSHNCAYYSLSTKNFSVSWNPRKKTGKIEPRWHIHGLPLEVFKPKHMKEILGENFKRKNIIYVREVYKHRWDFKDKHRVVRPKKSQIILSNKYMSSSLLNHFKSFGNEVLDIDPHHWSGINVGLLTLGIGYLVNRYTRVFAAVLNKLKEQGTEVAAICSSIVGQEGDGPLVYGNRKYAGFNAASFDHVALERVLLELMFAEDESGIIGFLKRRQKQRMNAHKIEAPELISEVEKLWTVEILQDLIGGVSDIKKIPIEILDYSNKIKEENIKPETLYKLREGKAFKSSLGYYCNPDKWLELLHNNDSLYLMMFLMERGSIDIPLIPGVVG